MKIGGGSYLTIEDHSDEWSTAFRGAVFDGLDRIGTKCEEYAADLAPFDTGRLAQSMTHTVNPVKYEVYVGTNVKYAVYQEMGTGVYADGGRRTPWAYQDARGNWHVTHGNMAHPFLKPAADDHKDTYVAIFQDALENADGV